MGKKQKDEKMSKNLRGHIVTGVEHAENGDLKYKGYVVKDNGDTLYMISSDEVDSFLKGGTMSVFQEQRKDITKDHGRYFVDLRDMLKELEKEFKIKEK